MRFYLGTHVPSWLAKPDAPALFISHRRLRDRKSFPRAVPRWSLDSGGFTELSMFGEWQTTPGEYVAAARRYMQEIGNLDWAAPQDWMCEPFMLDKTGLSVAKHQQLTLDNYLELRTMADDVPFIPVLQGWDSDDYHRHLDQYLDAVDGFENLPVVGIGSVCRRQSSDDIGRICSSLQASGIRLHGFGVKSGGLKRYGWTLESADSMAWSFGGRRIIPCPVRPVKNCANCYHHAIEWRAKALAPSLPAPIQMALV